MVQREPVGSVGGGGTLLTETPRSAYQALEARATLTTVGVLVALGALAWASTVARASEMSGMVAGFAPTESAMMPFAMSAGLFVGMWATMMAAMMLPTVAPIVLIHRMVTRRRGEGPLTSAAFIASYLAVWVVMGLVPFSLLLAVREVPRDGGWTVPFGGAVLILAGGYQFTRWKTACQRACRNPLSFVMTHDFGRGPLGSARVGAAHGLYCVGCCWGLMAVLLVVGLTNLAWMALISLIFLAEKHWRHAQGLSRVAGAALVMLGIVVLLQPSVLGSIAG